MCSEEAPLPRSLPHLSDSDLLLDLERAIERDDWDMARAAAERLGSDPAPETAAALMARAAELNRLVIAARARRAHLAASLARVQAANRFTASAADRQNLADPIDF
jgi:hypothetical protein